MTDREQGRHGWSLRGPELFGILLIFIGGLLLLASANVLRLSWNLVWPVLVIGVGAAILVSALRPRGADDVSRSIPRDGIGQLELELTVGGGTFRITGGATDLVATHSNHDDISARVDRNGPRGRVRLRQDPGWLPLGGGAASQWDVQVASDVPTALSVQAGAGSFDLDLSGIRVVDARMSFGAARARVVLPTPNGEVAVKISGGAASLTVQVPPGVEAQVRGTGGLMQIDGRPETPGYTAARDRVNVSVSGGVSQVRIL